MKRRLWVLGASDPEMEAIERLLRDAGEAVVHAIGPDGRRVHPGNAYQASLPPAAPGTTLYLVECDGPRPEKAEVVLIDHHRPGDPGYGRPPEEFLVASSLGQVIQRLAALGLGKYGTDGEDSPGYSGPGSIYLWDGWRVVDSLYGQVPVEEEHVLAAAADHCLAAAYRGQCPGVEPDTLMRWRVETRARHQGRPVEAVLADVEAAREALRGAPRVRLDPADPATEVADLRDREVPELPEAAARDGVAFVATPRPGPDGRRKVVLQCADAAHLVAWPGWAAREGLVELYGGDPARGFAGGYLP